MIASRRRTKTISKICEIRRYNEWMIEHPRPLPNRIAGQQPFKKGSNGANGLEFLPLNLETTLDLPGVEKIKKMMGTERILQRITAEIDYQVQS